MTATVTLPAIATVTGTIENLDRMVNGHFGFIVPQDGSGPNVFFPKALAYQAGLLRQEIREELGTAMVTVTVTETEQGLRATAITAAVNEEGESLLKVAAAPKARPAKKRPTAKKAAPKAPEHTLECYCNTSQVDSCKETDENGDQVVVRRLFKVKDLRGAHVRYLVADGRTDKVLQVLDCKLSLAEARMAFGHYVEAPQTAPGGATNKPDLSRAMKGKSAGGGKNKAA